MKGTVIIKLWGLVQSKETLSIYVLYVNYVVSKIDLSLHIVDCEMIWNTVSPGVILPYNFKHAHPFSIQYTIPIIE